MTIGGWITLVLTIGIVTAVHLWCVWRVIARARPDHELGHVEPIEKDQTDER